MNRLTSAVLALLLVAGTVASMCFGLPTHAQEAGATSAIRVVRYAADRTTVLEEKTVSHKWMEDNLPVYGDGVTHYYHQGPVFEGDPWDPSETQNLKDKGAVKGTDARDLCDLVGGMVPGDEVRFVAVDGWHTELAYENIYEPMERQGRVVLAWFNGEDSTTGEKYGTGYPGVEGFHSAIQMVIMAGTTNAEGKYVFGNDDMRVCLPQEEYQHFYQGLASTNGLSGKWISELHIYTQEEASATAAAAAAAAQPTPAEQASQVETATTPQASRSKSSGGLTPLLWAVLAIGVIGLVLIVVAFSRLRRAAR
jgi:hypothetical protein